MNNRYFRPVFNWMKRHVLVIALCIFGLNCIGFESETLRTLYTCLITGCTVIIFSGITVFALTTLDFIEKGDTNAIARIYFGNCILFGLIHCANYICQFR